MTEKKLYRSRENRMVGGVAAGLGDYFGVDPTIIRIGFVVLALINGIGIIAYLIGWFVIPEEPLIGQAAHDAKEQKKEATTDSIAHDVANDKTHGRISERGGQQVGGFVLITIGLIFLLERFTDTNIWKTYWPVVLIAIGLAIILRRTDRKE